MKREETRERILDAAVKVFAARGFRDATIRQICSAAGVNVSMVNYYFKTKEGLYAEVVRKQFSFTTTDAMAQLAGGVTDAKSWKAAVRRFIGQFVKYMSVTEEPHVFTARIFRWEVTRPSSICKELQMTYGRLVYEGLKKLVAMAIGDDPVKVKLWCAAIWSRVAMLALADEMWLENFIPQGMSRAEWVDAIAENECEIIFKSLKYNG